MRVNFSIKSVLVAIAYAALLAASIFQPAWGWAYLLWALTLLSLVVAIVALCFGRGPVQAKALGYVLLSSLVIFLIRYFPAVSPSRQVMYYVGVPVSQNISTFSPWHSLMEVSDARFQANNPKVNSHVARMEQMIVDASRAVAADAISVQLAGGLGIAIGGLTIRWLKRNVDQDNAQAVRLGDGTAQ